MKKEIKIPTDQEIFDKVAMHLLTQKKKALKLYSGVNSFKSETHVCALRGFSGTKCAIGCLIPDELYSSKMEKTSPRSLRKVFPSLLPYLGDNQDLLDRLQGVHDIYEVTQWRRELIIAAINSNISSKILETIQS